MFDFISDIIVNAIMLFSIDLYCLAPGLHVVSVFSILLAIGLFMCMMWLGSCRFRCRIGHGLSMWCLWMILRLTFYLWICSSTNALLSFLVFISILYTCHSHWNRTKIALSSCCAHSSCWSRKYSHSFAIHSHLNLSRTSLSTTLPMIILPTLTIRASTPRILFPVGFALALVDLLLLMTLYNCPVFEGGAHSA